MSRKEFILVAVGLLFIVAGLIFNERLLAYFTSDGQINTPSQLLIIRAFNVVCILLGAAIILFRRSRLISKLLIIALITLILFTLFDTLLYLFSPLLPQPIVLAMSPKAQIRHYRANADTLSWTYEQNIRHPKPETDLEIFAIPVKTDSLGYRNPARYIERQSKMDVVLMGDSFIWGSQETTIAAYLRQDLSPLTVYSLGMPGAGIPQWGYHYQRYAALTSFDEGPQIAVLNFFSGNDIIDTRLFLGLQDESGDVDAIAYYAYINHQYLAPTSKRAISLPKLPESLFLTSYMITLQQKSAVAEAAELNDSVAPDCSLAREPYPHEFDDRILEQIKEAAERIRTVSPETKIMFSYIPAGSAILGDSVNSCPSFEDDMNRQLENSRILEDFVVELGIHYLDFTPVLREKAQATNLWAKDDHFSAAGYELYSELLSEEIAQLIPPS